MSPLPVVRDQRGIALVMALLVLLVISLLSMTLLMSVNTDTKVAANTVRDTQALAIAEAGIGEACARITNGDIPTNTNARQVAQIFNAAPGSVPVLGVDSVALATAQPVSQWLAYSTAGKADSALTVQYKTNAARTVIYRYDPAKNPAVQTLTGGPIFVITSTGRKGASIRKITAEVIQKPFNVNVKGALTANTDVEFDGNAVICGHNHRLDTPIGKGEVGRSVPEGCYENPGANQWETGSGDVAGIWTGGGINNGGSAFSYGSPAMQPGQPGFYSGPWDALSMSQADFYSWAGAPVSQSPDPPNGIFNLDNDGIMGNQSGQFEFHNVDGEGFIYCDGDLTLNSDFSFKGLIYVEGDLKLNGNAWILGGLVVRGRTGLKTNGGATLLYSEDAIKQTLSKYGGQMVTLSWRETN
jgi:Tfp pilus assembly protein PilX